MDLTGEPAAATSPAAAEASPATSIGLVEETDGYTTAVAGIEIRSVRTGPGEGPNVVLATRGEGFVATAVRAGFPMLGRMTMDDDKVIMGVVKKAPPGSNWCGIDLEEGMVVCEGPAAEHTAVNPVGVEFAFAITSCGELAARADRLGTHFVPPRRGRVHALASTPQARFYGRTLSTVVQAAAAGVDPVHNREDDVMEAMAVALSDPGRARPGDAGHRRRVDTRSVVHTCIAYVDAIDRVPSIAELCLVTHVCERTLRNAFTECYGMGPHRFFTMWTLDRARQRLVVADPGQDTVTRIAADLGIGHLGRFAARYRHVYAEAPSETLDRAG